MEAPVKKHLMGICASARPAVLVINAKHKYSTNYVCETQLKTKASANYKASLDKLLKDCSEIYATGERISGVYTICPGSNVVDKEPIDVYCNIDEAGGWLVFQRRQDGTVDFYQNWAAYKNGFGDLEAEFWLGNDIIHRITYQGDYTLRIYMVDLNGQSLTALYNNFRVANESEGYRLKYLTYNATSSNAGDAMIFHNGHQFTTLDRDRDGNADENCAILYKGGWWYNACHWANLNGGWSYSDLRGMNWNQRSLRGSTMEIKAP
ncbi:ficolin-2-like [Strongylocentrotus purpuratus]|uniref:Fibrinogen C-terminal domain-containing protein n=1 Tax=Strongylocentrotus purpuratus TaxID=7668 RepID=A0A7M7NRZ6_STRPU|nr:ficolin-2-like [Strongylocentrotus purpuratus]